MATPKRRSARLGGRETSQRYVKSNLLDGSVLLGALIERDETPDTKAQPSIDNVLSTPAPNISIQSKFARLSNIKTPTSEPKPSHEQMHPHTIHQTTAKAPDSGMKLGFGDPPATGGRKSIATLQNSPSKTLSKPGDAKSNTQAAFEFKFRSGSHLSNEAQKLMDNLRDEAARIKEQLQAEKDLQHEKDADTDDQFQGFGAAGRKIAQPRGKAGRFSDVHMAAFKKMDSIANHASAFRANGAPSFAQPTAQSLKRSPSKAGFDEPVRPQTAGKGTPVRRPPPSRLPNRRTTTPSPFKSLPKLVQEAPTSIPAKRQRQSDFVDVSSARPQHPDQEQQPMPSAIPRPISSSGVPHSLLSPTKSSIARSNSIKVPTAAVDKSSVLPRSKSFTSLQPPRPLAGTPFKFANIEEPRTSPASPGKTVPGSTSKLPRSENAMLNASFPRLLTAQSMAQSTKSSLQKSQPSKTQSITSKLPTFADLKSILRPSRPQGFPAHASPNRVGTPKRPDTANMVDSAKKVDFTPSVKSRYAVKLAAKSPSSAMMYHDTPRPPTAQYDPAAYAMSDDTVDDEEWEDDDGDGKAESEVVYPTLPPSSPVQKKSPSVQTVQAFMKKAKGINRREPMDFKSITANGLHTADDKPFSMTVFNTTADMRDPTVNANKVMKSPSASKPSPSTIRRVLPSDTQELDKPLAVPEKYLSHGLPAKKRRHDSEKHETFDDTKENRRPSNYPAKVPGSWEESVLEEDEGEKRAGKRVRVEQSEDPATSSSLKRPNPAREAAARAAKDRKKSGILSMSRLNVLARPKGY